VNVEFLITGAGGQLGSVLLRRLTTAGRAAIGTVSPRGPRPLAGRVHACDLCDDTAVAAFVRELRPANIIHAAAMTSVAGCFENPQQAQRLNVEATRRLVELAEESGTRLVLTSTDLVFDGTTGRYDEASPLAPTSAYGRSKAAAEQIVLSYANGAVVRLALLYGLPVARRSTTFLKQLAALRDGTTLKLFHDEYRSALELEDAAAAVQRVASSDFVGVIHAAGPESLSRLEMGRIAAAALGVSDAAIESVSQRDILSAEPRPADVSLTCQRFENLFGSQPGRQMSETMPEIARQFVSGTYLQPP